MDVDELVEIIDIGEYIGQYVDLCEGVDGTLWGLSPFKDECTPSFSVEPDKGLFYDFSSGQGGNVFTFAKLYFNLSGKQAVEKLCEYVGVDGETLQAKERLAPTSFCKKYKRRKRPVKQADNFKYPPNHMQMFEYNEKALRVWEKEGISLEVMKKFDVRYDPFGYRIVYPIKNLDGDIVNVGGRTLDPDYKAKKIRKYTYYRQWGTIELLYGLYEHMADIKEKGFVILFEGVKSVLIAETWGIKNTAALLTCHLSQNQFKILIRLGVRVVFALDKGVFIPNETRICNLRHYVTTEYLVDYNGLLDDKDAPVDKGKEVFKTLYENRRSL